MAMLKESHVYLLPILREGVPVTQLEAMASGCVPLVASCGGAGPMALEAGSVPILVGSATDMAVTIAERLGDLFKLPLHWRAQSENSARVIRVKYSGEHYRTEINGFYRLAVNRSVH